MATTAESFSVWRASTKAPISTHPAFPAIIALWFAALLGLGSQAVPVALLERLVALTGLAVLVPAAAPPLGFTAHVGIALGAAVVGAFVGLILAQRVAKGHAAGSKTPQFVFDEARKCRPISVHDELGEEGLASAADASPEPNSRRSLAAADNSPAGTHLPVVPVPGFSEDPASSAARFEAPALGVSEFGAPFEKPLDLGDFSHPGQIGESETTVLPIVDRPLAELGLVQLTERLGAALAKRAARPAANPVEIADLKPAKAEETARAIADFFGPARSRELDAPLSPLGEDGSSEGSQDVDYSSLLAMKNPFAR